MRTARIGVPATRRFASRRVHGWDTSGRSSVISATRSCVLAPRMAARATRTASCPSAIPGATSDQAARKMRRARFRSTAPPTFRPAMNAACPVPGARNTTTRSPWSRFGTPRTRRTSGARTGTRSDGQPSASLAAPRADDGAAGPRPHAMTEAVHLRTMAVVRLVRSLALGHAGGSLLDAGSGTAGGHAVYGWSSSLDKALDKRKCVKTPAAACGVEKPRAMVQPAFPPVSGS